VTEALRHDDDEDETTRDLARRGRPMSSDIVPAQKVRSVVPAPRGGKLVRRSFDSMRGCIVAKRYRITRAIGAGGMGTVYEAVDIRTGLVVALKALSGTDDRKAVAVQRLRREAETAITIRSDHVCQVHYLGVEGGTPFIVMERLHGETLRARLMRDGALPVADAVAITLQLLDALAAAHASSVLHRDVKPGNVFILSQPGRRPRIKLIDFGLAKLLRAQDARSDAPDITAPNGIPGTLQYLAPEQLLGVADPDQRVDIYAAGLVFYEMLSGGRAYHGDSFDEVVRRIVLEPPPSVSDLRPDAPPVLDDVLGMALAKERSRRFLTATAFRRALSAAWSSSEGHVPAAVAPPPVALPPAKTPAKTPTMAMATPTPPQFVLPRPVPPPYPAHREPAPEPARHEPYREEARTLADTEEDDELTDLEVCVELEMALEA